VDSGQARPASEHGGAAERSQLGQQASTAARPSAACQWHSRGGGTTMVRAHDLRERGAQPAAVRPARTASVAGAAARLEREG